MDDYGTALGIRLAHGLRDALTEGDPRDLAAAWSELRSEARHLPDESPVRMAVAIVGEVMGLDGATNSLWSDARELGARLSYLCSEEEYEIALGRAEREPEVWTHEPNGDTVHHILGCQGDCEAWCLKPYVDWRRIHRAPQVSR